MQYKVTALNYITASNTQNTFNIDYVVDTSGFKHELIVDKQKLDNTVFTTTLFGEITETDSMSKTCPGNFGSLYNITSAFVIHNLYDIKDSKLRSYLIENHHAQNANYQHISSYYQQINTDFIDVCQVGSYAFGLTPRSSTQMVSPSVKFLTNNDVFPDSSYVMQLQERPTNTYLYPTPSQLGSTTYFDFISAQYIYGDATNQINYSVISSIFDPVVNLLSVKYNYLVDIQENSLYNNYKYGYILANTIQCKNQLGSNYSMNVSQTYSGNNKQYEMTGCRDYCGVGKYSTTLYLKYRDSVNYQSDNGQVVEVDGIISKNIKNTSISSYVMSETKPKYSYQHIETIRSINKFNNNIGHKSNLFSIRIRNSGLNTTTLLNEKARSLFKKDIENNVRLLANMICPANTQLFNVYFTGV